MQAHASPARNARPRPCQLMVASFLCRTSLGLPLPTPTQPEHMCMALWGPLALDTILPPPLTRSSQRTGPWSYRLTSFVKANANGTLHGKHLLAVMAWNPLALFSIRQRRNASRA